MSPLEGRTAVVTGASRGIGLEIAERLEAGGARVVRVSRSLSDERSGNRIAIRCDLTHDAEVQKLARRVLESFGPPALLVNNAGTFLLKPFEQTSAREFAEQLGSNLQGPFHLTRAFLPAMREAGGGRLITIGSVADHRAFPGNAAYSAAKYGLRGLHEVLREEYRGSGVLCTLISPGPTDTAAWDPYDPDHRADLPVRSAMLSPADVAEAVLYVATRSPQIDIDWLRIQPWGIENRE
jgi:NAD(P)-dependent dehydrogenase (short-subunit alcohol dehydrogenase family)